MKGPLAIQLGLFDWHRVATANGATGATALAQLDFDRARAHFESALKADNENSGARTGLRETERWQAFLARVGVMGFPQSL